MALPDPSSISTGKSYLISGGFLRDLLAKLDSICAGDYIQRGPGIYLRKSGAAGIAIKSAAPAKVTPTQGAPVTPPDPFQIFITKHMAGTPPTWDGSYDVTLYPGTMNGSVPANILNSINRSIGDTLYVVLTCQSDGYQITSCTWDLLDASPALPDAKADLPDTTFSYLLGLIAYIPPVGTAPASARVYQIVSTNLNATPIEWIRTGRNDTGPFDFPYVVYYAWKVESANS